MPRLSRGRWRQNKSEPKFNEFVKFLINTDIQQYDEDWQPVALRCRYFGTEFEILFSIICFRVCQLPYSHILHYENISLEWPQFLKKIGIARHIELPWENKGDGNALKNYFENVSEKEKIELFEKFVSDFEMFDYTLEDNY